MKFLTCIHLNFFYCKQETLIRTSEIRTTSTTSHDFKNYSVIFEKRKKRK